MSLDTPGLLVLVLLGATLVASAWGWTPLGRQIWTPASVLLLAAAGITAAAPPAVEIGGRGGTTLLVLLAGAVAIWGGGPITARVFGWVDAGDHPANVATPIRDAGELLRGGTWIGALERAAVFAALIAGWPEALAVVLALKGLGRYPELRAAEARAPSGAAERFIIGTFTSVLWACACAAVVAVAG